MASENWKLLWDKKALEDISKIGKQEAKTIFDKVENYLLRDPLKLGKTLKGKLKTFHKYRIGKYRVIYTIERKKVTIIIVKVGKRDKVYKT